MNNKEYSCENHKSPHKKRVLTFGVFDYLHLGHLRLFKQCKEYGNYLIVAVQDGSYIKRFKPGEKIFYTTDERVEMLKALRIVDYVIVYEVVGIEALEKIDQLIGFDILALGEDHIGERFDKMSKWCNEHGKSVVRLKRTHGVSSTEIKQKISG